jgi:carbonic anhydrase
LLAADPGREAAAAQKDSSAEPDARVPAGAARTLSFQRRSTRGLQQRRSICARRHPGSRHHPRQRCFHFKTSPAPDLGLSPYFRQPTPDLKSSIHMSTSYDQLFENNLKWVESRRATNSEFFEKLASDQTPEFLYIGCSDSRIPAEVIMGTEAGEVFVHRNIANMVVSTDLNVMSVIEYAVKHLHVKHVIVCGHYNCGGVKAAMTPKDLGLLNPWLRNIRDVYRLHEEELDTIADNDLRYDRLVELNAIEQARNVIKTAAVQEQFLKYGYPEVHAWAFGLKDGILKDLKLDFKGTLKDIQKIYNLQGEVEGH